MTDRTLQEFIDVARAADTREKALVAIVAKLKGKVVPVVEKYGLSPADQEKLNEAFDAITANDSEVQAAIDADLAEDEPLVQPEPDMGESGEDVGSGDGSEADGEPQA